MSSLTFGPVPSRRLGHSLGINNIPPKTCSYSCVYCQVGKTTAMRIDREAFYDPDEIARSVKLKVGQAKEKGKPVDYLTFVADGEPSLDVNLGSEIDLLRSSDIKIAVITNASLLWREDVRHDLQKADWVSIKTDAVSEKVWRRIDRPHKLLKLDEILDGAITFREKFSGELTTETMLVRGFNDDEQEFGNIANFLSRLRPAKSYLAVPTRPPADRLVRAASEKALNEAYQVFAKKLDSVEYLVGYEGNAFACTGNIEDDLLSITSVHPMREDAVREMLEKACVGWGTIEGLLTKGIMIETEYEGKKFYMRKLLA
jgi:wyosine [tRNA(Phe)-imidazoG37] synthetase (radical SAM superfamily)